MTMAKTCSVGVVVLATTLASACASEPPPPAMPPPMMPVAPPPPMVAAPQMGPCDQVQSLSASSSLLARSADEAPGMKPDGGTVCGNVPEGQVVTGPSFLLEQGYCYTFLGQGQLPGVTEVDMELQIDLAPGGVPLPPMLAAMAQRPLLVDTLSGDKAAMATRQSCFQWAFPVPGNVKLIVKAVRGSGAVSAQAFRKKKL